jgi:hypothetical protein
MARAGCDERLGSSPLLPRIKPHASNARITAVRTCCFAVYLSAGWQPGDVRQRLIDREHSSALFGPPAAKREHVNGLRCADRRY